MTEQTAKKDSHDYAGFTNSLIEGFRKEVNDYISKAHDPKGPMINLVHINTDMPHIIAIPISPGAALYGKYKEMEYTPIKSAFFIPETCANILKSKPRPDLLLVDVTHDVPADLMPQLDRILSARAWAHKIAFVNFSQNAEDVFPTRIIPTLDREGLKNLTRFDHDSMMEKRVREPHKKTFLEKLFL